MIEIDYIRKLGYSISYSDHEREEYEHHDGTVITYYFNIKDKFAFQTIMGRFTTSTFQGLFFNDIGSSYEEFKLYKRKRVIGEIINLDK